MTWRVEHNQADGMRKGEKDQSNFPDSISIDTTNENVDHSRGASISYVSEYGRNLDSFLAACRALRESLWRSLRAACFVVVSLLGTLSGWEILDLERE